MQNLDRNQPIVNDLGCPTEYFMRIMQNRGNDQDGKIDKPGSSSDNAVVRFDGLKGDVQNSAAILTDDGNFGLGTSTPLFSIHAEAHNTTDTIVYVSDGAADPATASRAADFPCFLTLASSSGNVSFFQLGYTHETYGTIANFQSTNNTLEFDHNTAAGAFTGANILMPEGGYAVTDVNYTNFGGIYKLSGTTKFAIGGVHSSFVLANHPTPALFFDTADNRVGVNTAAPNANAILDLTSTSKAFMPPRMTTAQKNAIPSPAAGMVVYDTTLNAVCVYTSAWQTLGGGATGSGGTALVPYPSNTGLDVRAGTIFGAPGIDVIGAYADAAITVNGVFIACVATISGLKALPVLYGGIDPLTTSPNPVGAALLASGPSVTLANLTVHYCPFTTPFVTTAGLYYYVGFALHGATGNPTLGTLGANRRSWFLSGTFSPAPNPLGSVVAASGANVGFWTK